MSIEKSEDTEGKEEIVDNRVAYEISEAVATKLKSATNRFSVERAAILLEAFWQDFRRGIVRIDDIKTVRQFRAALKKDKSADCTFEEITDRLTANDGESLLAVETMQGGGELIGILPNGKLCIKDRGNEPVIYARDAEGNLIVISSDTPDRVRVVEELFGHGTFANEEETIKAALAAGYTLPKNYPDHKTNRGLVAAIEAVTGVNYQRNPNPLRHPTGNAIFIGTFMGLSYTMIHPTTIGRSPCFPGVIRILEV